MSIYTIIHTTKYKYAGKVGNSANQIILFPKSENNQNVLEQRLTLSPVANVDYFHDYFQNKVGVFTVAAPHGELVILSELRVETNLVPFPDVHLSAREQWRDLRAKANSYPYVDFLLAEKFEYSGEVLDVLRALVSDEKGVLESVQAVSSYINQTFQYRQGVTSIETKVDEIWETKTGVCQDFTHMMIAMLRLVGIPSRYVSGYICPSSGHEMRGEGATHAWVEVYIPEYGWMGNDPTNNCWVEDRHVKIAFGRDFKDCTPVKGTYEGSSSHTLYVSVQITGDDGSRSGYDSDLLGDIDQRSQKKFITDTLETQDQANSYQKYIQQQQQQQ